MEYTGQIVSIIQWNFQGNKTYLIEKDGKKIPFEVSDRIHKMYLCEKKEVVKIHFQLSSFDWKGKIYPVLECTDIDVLKRIIPAIETADAQGKQDDSEYAHNDDENSPF